ncbi:unnamed protein product, partial [Medioppia subpectinata]
ELLFVQFLSLILLFVIIFITIIGNIFVITAVTATPKLQIRFNYLILSLSIADLMVGALSMPVFAYHEMVHLNDWRMGYSMCHIHNFVTYVLSIALFYHIFFIAIDRYVSVSRVDYSRNRSLRPVWVMIGILWTLAVAKGMGRLVGHMGSDMIYVESMDAHLCLWSDDPDYWAVGTVIIAMILFVIIYSLYPKILCITRTHKSREFRNKTQTNANRSIAGIQQQKSTDRALSREFQVAIRSIIFTMVFTLCLLPYCFVYLTINRNQLDYQSVAFIHLFIWCLYINSMLNPIVYSLFNRDFQFAFKRLMLNKSVVNLVIIYGTIHMVNARVTITDRLATRNSRVSARSICTPCATDTVHEMPIIISAGLKPRFCEYSTHEIVKYLSMAMKKMWRNEAVPQT